MVLTVLLSFSSMPLRSPCRILVSRRDQGQFSVRALYLARLMNGSSSASPSREPVVQGSWNSVVGRCGRYHINDDFGVMSEDARFVIVVSVGVDVVVLALLS